MTMPEQYQCLIWPEYPATETQDIRRDTTFVESHRCGGRYEITSEAVEQLSTTDDATKARLTSMLLEMRKNGGDCPRVNTELIERARSGTPRDPDERALLLLRYLVSVQTSLGGLWRLAPDEIATALAQSESINTIELDFMFRFLDDRGYAETQLSANATYFAYSVTMDGFAAAREVTSPVVTGQVFVAMWFDERTASLYDEGIKLAVEATGYAPYIINRDPSVNKIDDAIVAAIRESRFVVADFTHGNDGVRGSVYFEAGFAYGLGMEVIHTCRRDLITGVHFDTRQYNHLGWTKPKDIIEPLKDAILARVGRGPIPSAQSPN